jgi:glucose-6-phosphate isomerase
MEATTRIDSFSFSVDPSSGVITPHDNLIQRRLSHMKGMFVDEPATEAVLEREDRLLYEVYEIPVRLETSIL